jgi:hypothetical protein
LLTDWMDELEGASCSDSSDGGLLSKMSSL